MDKLGDPTTIAAGAGIVVAVGGLIHTNNKISEIRRDLDEVTGHLATTIGEKGSLERIKDNIDKLGKAVQALNINIREVANVIHSEHELRNLQFTSILSFMETVGEVPSETSQILTRKIQMVPQPIVHRDSGFHDEIGAVRSKSTVEVPSNRREVLRNLGIG